MTYFFRVGIITSVHGLKGEGKVFPTGEEPDRFALYGTILLGREGEQEADYHPYEIQGIKQAKRQLILKLSGVDSPEEARLLSKREIYIPREKAVPLKEGEHYVADLIGCAVFEGEERLGVLTDVLKTGANDVYVCKTEEGKELYLPVIPDCVLSVDTDRQLIRVRLLPGLKELYL